MIALYLKPTYTFQQILDCFTMRCAFRDTNNLCELFGLTDLRQSKYLTKKLKKQWRKVQKLKHSTSKNPEKKALQKTKIKQAHEWYCEIAEGQLNKITVVINKLNQLHTINPAKLTRINEWLTHAKRQIDQIKRRVIHGEKIPHKEKVFSIFEPHTEWISKGKAGVPVELGLRTCIIESSDGFILNYRVMEKTTDDAIIVEFIDETQKIYPQLKSCSMDKGFHSPSNQRALAKQLDLVVLPKKGKWSKADRERESAEDFVAARCQHSAVESSINALQQHGLSLCRDKGLEGLKRYVGVAVVARNIQKIGVILRDKERDRLMRLRKKLKKAA